MNIYWDTQNHQLIRSLTQGQMVQKLEWILRDQVAVILYLCTPDDTTQEYTAALAPAGWAVKFAAKDPDDLTADPPPVYQGTWAQHATEIAYEATINLNTSELIAAVSDAAKLDLTAEFVLQDAEGNNRDSTQITLRVKPDVNRSGDGVPTAEESWPWIEEIVDPDTGERRVLIKNSLGEVRAEL